MLSIKKILHCLMLTVSLVTVSCATDPFTSILISGMAETKREAGNNYLLAKQMQDEGRPQEAFWKYRLSANGGHPMAAYVMGTYYVEGIHAPRSYDVARHYFYIAAYKADLREAYLYLADIDFYGRGRPRATDLGYKWMLIGTRDNSLLRAKMRTEMDPEMTSGGRAHAQKHALAWMRARNLDPAGVAIQ
jgi:hypothetical protein